uniref:Mid2 domain-containing protein n=1 Tax=Panagrellus redivivus TaxID=6233 RepID=A0A7E4VT92_PANRE
MLCSSQFAEREVTYALNRQGQLSDALGWNPEIGNVVFESDGSINILVADISSMMTVILLNADIPVVTTTTLAPNKENRKWATIGIVGVGILLIVIVIIGIIAWYYCFCKRQKCETNQTEGLNRTYEVDTRPPQKVIVKTPMASQQKHPKLPTSTTLTKGSSSATTKVSGENPQTSVAPTKISTTPTVQETAEVDCVSIIPDSTCDKSSGNYVPKRSQQSSVKRVIAIEGSKIL